VKCGSGYQPRQIGNDEIKSERLGHYHDRASAMLIEFHEVI
jgi:hypothetical protein